MGNKIIYKNNQEFEAIGFEERATVCNTTMGNGQLSQSEEVKFYKAALVLMLKIL